MKRADLDEELAFLQASIEDLEREHSVGDVNDRDYRRLLARYERRAAAVRAAMPAGPASQGEAPAGQPRRKRSLLATRRARLLTGWGAFCCFGVALAFLVMSLAGVGPFVVTPPLSVGARVQIMLAEASVLGSRGEVTQALATYDKVLALQPAQPEALADGGWLARLAGLSEHKAGLVANGDAEIGAAVRIDPGFAIARAYEGIVLYSDKHQPRQAVADFNSMLADHPSQTLLWSVRTEALSAYKAAKETAPAAIVEAQKPKTSGTVS